MGKFFARKFDGVVDVLAPIFTLSTFSGVFTLRSSKKGVGLEFSPWKAIFAVAVLIGCSLHLFLIPDSVERLETTHISNGSGSIFDRNSQQFITKLVNPILVSANAIAFGLLVVLRMHRFLPKLVERLVENDRLLSLSPDHHGRDRKAVLLLVAYVFATSVPFQCYSVLPKTTSHSSDFMFLINSYNNVTAASVEFQFVAFCFVIFARLAVVNARLASFEEKLPRRADPRVNYSTICKQIDTPRLAKNDDVFRTAAEIAALRSAYRALSDASERLSDGYGLKLLISLFACTVNVLLNFYFAIFGGYHTTSIRNVAANGMPNAVHDLIWAFYYFQRFAWVCYAAAFLSQEGKRTKVALSAVLNRKWDRDTRKELKYFLCYAMNRKFQFVPCGFFRLDMTLVTSAVAAGATYLVILAQFHRGC